MEANWQVPAAKPKRVSLSLERPHGYVDGTIWFGLWMENGLPFGAILHFHVTSRECKACGKEKHVMAGACRLRLRSATVVSDCLSPVLWEAVISVSFVGMGDELESDLCVSFQPRLESGAEPWVSLLSELFHQRYPAERNDVYIYIVIFNTTLLMIKCFNPLNPPRHREWSRPGISGPSALRNCSAAALGSYRWAEDSLLEG